MTSRIRRPSPSAKAPPRVSDKKKSEKTYQAEYYAQNKDRLKKERAERYKHDEKYRAEHKTRSERHYWLKRRPKRQRSKDDVRQESPELPRPVAIVIVKIPGVAKEVETKVYTSVALMVAMQRTRQALAAWEEQGVIPPPAMRKKDLDHLAIRGTNPRLYTEAELAILQECAYLLKLPRKTLPESVFSKEVTRLFAELYRGVRRPK